MNIESPAPTDMNELFSRNPLELTNDDISEVIAYMRDKRSKFIAAPAAKPRATTKKKLTDAEQRAKALKLDFGI
jgi:hypothetical protein